MRWATRVARACSVKRGSRWSVKQAATRSNRRVDRPIRLSSNAPALEVIAPPLNEATTLRPWQP